MKNEKNPNLNIFYTVDSPIQLFSQDTFIDVHITEDEIKQNLCTTVLWAIIVPWEKEMGYAISRQNDKNN